MPGTVPLLRAGPLRQQQPSQPSCSQRRPYWPQGCLVAEGFSPSGRSAPAHRPHTRLHSSGSSASSAGGELASVLVEGDAEVHKLVSLLPPAVRTRLEAHPRLEELLEVVMDLGRPPLARFPGGDIRLAEGPVTEEDLRLAVQQVGEFGGDNRAGIDKTLHRISCIRNRAGRVVGLTCRVGRAISGSASMISDLVKGGGSILLLGRPGVGKTTAIREVARMLADECARRVVIVDTSNEIGGDGDVAHPGIGRARRMQVPQPEAQHRVMIEAVENHMPEVIVIDEIGTEAEALAARTIAQRGVQLVATAHGNQLENLMKNPTLNDLVGGICSVTLGDDEAKRRGMQKSVLERESPPTFDVAVEMVSRDEWRIHLDVGWAVDELLLGKDAGTEVRERDVNGRVWCWPEDGSVDFDDSDGSGDDAEGAAGPPSSSGSSSMRRPLPRPIADPQPFPAQALSAARDGAAALAARSSLGAPQQQQRASGPSSSSGGPRLLDSSPGTKKAASSSNGGRNGGKQAAAAGALHLYPFGVEAEVVSEVVDVLQLQGKLVVTAALQDADAVLALRTKLKSSAWIKGAAKTAGIPIFQIKSGAQPHVVKAIRTLVGIDPSPGALFSDSSSLFAADPKFGNGRLSRAETSIAVVAAVSAARSPARGGGGGSAAAVTVSPLASAANEKDALDEARRAVEQIVMPRGQAIELLPREARIVELQVALVQEHNLSYSIVGTANSLRLRILPQGPPRPAPEDLRPPTVEGAVQKEFW